MSVHHNDHSVSVLPIVRQAVTQIHGMTVEPFGILEIRDL